jgi:hypothetical protein
MPVEGGLNVRMVEALERMASAQEELNKLAREQAEEPMEEFTPGPPICPHCGTFNPSIRNEGGTGPWVEYVLAAYCDNCGNTFLAQAQGWQVYKDRAEYEGREDVIS